MGFPWISMLHGGFRKVMGVPPKSSISLGLSRSQKHHPLLAWGTPMTLEYITNGIPILQEIYGPKMEMFVKDEVFLGGHGYIIA